MDRGRRRKTGRRAIPTTTGIGDGIGKTGGEGEGKSDKEDHPHTRTGRRRAGGAQANQDNGATAGTGTKGLCTKDPLGTTPEEEAEQEDSTEPLERLPPRRGREKRAKGPAPPVGGSQQRAKGPTPVAEAEGKQKEASAAPKEVAPKQVLPDIGREPLCPDLGNE